MAVHRANEQEEEEMLGECAAVLRGCARRLNLRRFRIPLLLPYYHLLADALIWLDEDPPWPWRISFELSNALRPLFYYRTGLILGDVRPYGRIWELGRRLFPCWVGFHPSRCRRDRRLARLYRSARLEAHRTLHQDIRESQGEGT
jgi:hypothetical protein